MRLDAKSACGQNASSLWIIPPLGEGAYSWQGYNGWQISLCYQDPAKLQFPCRGAPNKRPRTTISDNRTSNCGVREMDRAEKSRRATFAEASYFEVRKEHKYAIPSDAEMVSAA